MLLSKNNRLQLGQGIFTRKEWPLFHNTAAIFTRIYSLSCAYKLSANFSRPIVLECMYHLCIDIARKTLFAYLSAFHVNYLDIFSHSLTSFLYES